MRQPEDEILTAFATPARGTILTDAMAMEIALNIARRGTGFVSPNPLVGAVLCDGQGRFVQAGAHMRVGSEHAEVAALKNISTSELRGATLYVTLEPCAHAGRTPSCAKMLATLPLSRVVAALQDPNPLTNGAGFKIIAAAGITCEWLMGYAESACELAEFFVTDMTEKRPFVGLKAALSQEGMIAERGAKRAWLSNSRSREYGHYLRLKYDAIAVGQNTLLLDEPTLTQRRADISQRLPWRIVFDPDLRGWRTLSKKHSLVTEQPTRTIWIVAEEDASTHDLTEIQCTSLKVLVMRRGGRNLVDPQAVLKELYSLGIRSLLLEGGTGLYGAFLDAELVDKVHLFYTPKQIAAAQGIHWLSASSKQPRYKVERRFTLASDGQTDTLFEAKVQW